MKNHTRTAQKNLPFSSPEHSIHQSNLHCKQKMNICSVFFISYKKTAKKILLKIVKITQIMLDII